MITGTELTDAYLRHIGYKRVGKGIKPILPFFMLDAMYQIYRSYIAPLDVKHELKQARNRWIYSYNLFNREFFSAFTQDQQDAIIDRMDNFESYIHNELEIAKIQVMNLMKYDDLDRQMVISASILCNILAQSANSIWEDTYVNKKGEKIRNKHIDAIEFWTIRFREIYHNSRYYVDPNKNENVCRSISALCRKMVKWINEDFTKNN